MPYIAQPQAEFFHNSGIKRSQIECVFGERGCGASYAAAAKILTMLTPIDGSVLCIGRTERHAQSVMADKLNEVSRNTFFNGVARIRSIGINDSNSKGSRHDIVWVDSVQQLPVNFFDAAFHMTEHVIITTTDAACISLPESSSISVFSQQGLVNFLLGRNQSDPTNGIELTQILHGNLKQFRVH